MGRSEFVGICSGLLFSYYFRDIDLRKLKTTQKKEGIDIIFPQRCLFHRELLFGGSIFGFI